MVGGVDPTDLPDPHAALAALDAAGFVVSLEIRHSAVTERADVVLPVAAAEEKGGTFLDWEGRPRPFAPVLNSSAMSDYRVLDLLAGQSDVQLGPARPGLDPGRAGRARGLGRRAGRGTRRTGG